MFFCNCFSKKPILNDELKIFLFDDAKDVDTITQNLFADDREAKIMIELYNQQSLNPIKFIGQKCKYYVSPKNNEGIALFPTFYLSKSNYVLMKHAKHELNSEAMIAISILKPTSDEIDKINLKIQECKYGKATI